VCDVEKLEMRTKTVHEVRHSELERFVGRVYGQDWSFVAAEEASNDTQHTFQVNGQVTSDDMDAVGGWQLDAYPSYCPSAQMILDDLCSRLMIPAGEYLVKVSW
jgi:hypothetical protein